MNIEFGLESWLAALAWAMLALHFLCLGRYAMSIWSWVRRLPVSAAAGDIAKFDSLSAPLITVVIPCRNEAESLPFLLEDLGQQTVPLALLVIDDHSTDGTKNVAEAAGVRCIKNPGEGKKAALRQAHSQIKTPWMATLDADVRIGKDWALSMEHSINQSTSSAVGAILGTVRLNATPESAWERFQALEYGCLMAWIEGGVCAEKLAMGSGANSVNRTSTYPAESLNEAQASGDDAYALLAIKKHGSPIAWNSDPQAFATTQPVQNWTELWNQRARWASKTHDQADGETKSVGQLIAAVELTFLFALLGTISSSDVGFLWILVAAILKILLNQPLISRAARRYKLTMKSTDVLFFPWRYAALVWGAWWQLLRGNVKWKGRQL